MLFVDLAQKSGVSGQSEAISMVFVCVFGRILGGLNLADEISGIRFQNHLQNDIYFDYQRSEKRRWAKKSKRDSFQFYVGE